MKLTEVTYDSSGKGSLKWFLQNFFTFSHEEDYESGTGYEIKPGFRITARGAEVIGVDTYPNDDYEFVTKHSVSGNPIKGYVNLNDLVVYQVKQIWPPKN